METQGKKRKPQNERRPAIKAKRFVQILSIKLPKPTKSHVDQLHNAGLLSDAMWREFYRTRPHWGTP